MIIFILHQITINKSEFTSFPTKLNFNTVTFQNTKAYIYATCLFSILWCGKKFHYKKSCAPTMLLPDNNGNSNRIQFQICWYRLGWCCGVDLLFSCFIQGPYFICFLYIHLSLLDTYTTLVFPLALLFL